MPSNRAETVFARREHWGSVYQTLLGKRLVSSRISTAEVARVASVRRCAVSDFFHGRIKKVGKQNCRRIRAALIDLGILKPRPHRPPACRNCGIIYPTRRGAPLVFRPGPDERAADGPVAKLPETRGTKP